METEEKESQAIFARMARLCSKAEQCTPDIRKKIRELGGNSLLTEKIIARLEQESYLNDERYVSTYISDKMKLNRWGRIKIRYYLKMKGLNEKVIQMGLASIDDAEYVRLLVRTMKEKAKGIKKADKYEKMGQIIRFTQSRGFEPELIHRHLHEVTG